MSTPISPSAIATSALPVGTRLGEFEITGVVGEGGFGIVYSAHDSSLDRIVAVKEYLPAAFSQRTEAGAVQVKSVDHSKTFAAGLSSFINEAKMLARFSHPGLVEVFRFWEANGTAYMAMRYYRGVTLRELLRTTPQIVTEQWLCETLDPLLLALKVLHNEKCYHRDIAPDNILVQPNGRSVLMDFGATRRIIGGMTQALTTVLKPGFAPIEQYSDDGSMQQGAWTDIYAVGGLLYNAMTGKVPVQAISRMMSDPLKPVAMLSRGNFSARLSDVVMKCMAVLPANRYQSVEELRAALGWVTTPGISTVIHPETIVAPVADDYPATVILSSSSRAAIAARAAAMVPAREAVQGAVVAASDDKFDPLATVGKSAPLGKMIQGVEIAASEGGFDPLATVISKPAKVPAQPQPQPQAQPQVQPLFASGSGTELDPLAALTAPSVPITIPTPVPGPRVNPQVQNQPSIKAVSPAGLSRRAKILSVASIAIVAIAAVAVAFFHRAPDNQGDAITAVPLPLPPVAQTAPSGVAPLPESQAVPSSVAQNPAPVAAEYSTLNPVPVLASPNGAAPGNSSPVQPVTGGTVPAATTGNVRFELKDGWGTVFVDGEQKGTVPPVMTVKLSPGSHEIELRNPALPTVKRTVEVIPGKTVVVRHTFAK